MMAAMTVLPLVDLLILVGTGAIGVGFVLKAVAITTVYRPTFLGFSSLDMLLIAVISFAMALVIAARTWLKLNEPHLRELERRLGEERARQRARELRGEMLGEPFSEARSEPAVSEPRSEAALSEPRSEPAGREASEPATAAEEGFEQRRAVP